MGYCGRLQLQLVGARPTLSGHLETRRVKAMEVTLRGGQNAVVMIIKQNKDAAGIQITAPKIRESRALG